MKLGLELSRRCTARCAHCSTGCGPDRTPRLDTAAWCDIIDDAANFDDGHQLEFALTGGEPFLDMEQLLAITRHAVSRGARVSCMTNAFWATNLERAVDVLAPLVDAGLGMLGVSTSRYHERYVPAARVGHALAAAGLLGIRSALKLAVVDGDQPRLADPDWHYLRLLADETEQAAVVAPGRDTGALDSAPLIRMPGLPQGRCPAMGPMVADDGTVLACCASARTGRWHEVGSALGHGLSVSIRRAANDPTLAMLRQHGPSHIAEALSRRGLADRLRSGYADVCDLCSHLATDPLLAAAGQAFAKSETLSSSTDTRQDHPDAADRRTAC